MCEEPTLYSERFPRGRKQRVCIECRRLIQAGEYYHAVSGVWGGAFSHYVTCWQCQTMRLHLLDIGRKEWGWDYCFGFGELKEQWWEAYNAPLGQCAPSQGGGDG